MTTGLLARMSELSNGSPRPGELASITAHLSELLNTRRASAPVDPRYGMPDFTDAVHNFPAGITALQRMIESVIEQYEPRLTHVSVRPLELSTERLVLRFEVRAQLHNGTRLRLETKMAHGGRIAVV